MVYNILIPCLLFIGFMAWHYPKWSYKCFDKRSEINSKHPDWYPKCGINFIEKDPDWFVLNGYGEELKKLGVKV